MKSLRGGGGGWSSCEVLNVLKCGWSGVARTVEVVAVSMIKESVKNGFTTLFRK